MARVGLTFNACLHFRFWRTMLRLKTKVASLMLRTLMPLRSFSQRKMLQSAERPRKLAESRVSALCDAAMPITTNTMSAPARSFKFQKSDQYSHPSPSSCIV